MYDTQLFDVLMTFLAYDCSISQYEFQFLPEYSLNMIKKMVAKGDIFSLYNYFSQSDIIRYSVTQVPFPNLTWTVSSVNHQSAMGNMVVHAHRTAMVPLSMFLLEFVYLIGLISAPSP